MKAREEWWRCAAAFARVCTLAGTATLFVPSSSHAQTTEDRLRIIRLAATPLGALPPSATLMPASRNHNYWGARLQAGHRRGGSEADQFAIAGGIDFQWRGGSVLGVTGGYRTVRCEAGTPACGGDGALFGARAQLNLLSGGPTIGALFGDYSATTTLGTEIGFGYARNALPAVAACTIDLGVPISHAMRQHVRVVAFVSPGVAWEIGCSAEASPSDPSYVTNIGIGVQQLGGRALDVHLGAQKIFRSGAGYQFGITVTYVRMP
ncbi:MAG TPA: hypothetical protein VMN60_10370 [Longimicrobiales bacterium]|nr:hypothetical protein [Longimicrobiales bacterium]